MRRSQDIKELAENTTDEEFRPMNPDTAFIGNDPGTMLLGGVLIVAVLFFAWFDYRRTSRLPNLGTVMVKNRLKGSN